MANVNVNSNGNAPAGLSVGDTVDTGGGNYTITAPGTAGSFYNPSSGYWSIRTDSISDPVTAGMTSAKDLIDYNNNQYRKNAQEANLWSAMSQERQYEYNAKQAQINRDWQEKMSNTAHQREVKDLLAAGLNPVLSAMNGAGATTPSGASASGSSYQGQKADVDTQALGVLSSIMNSVINRDTSLKVSEMQTNMSLLTAQIAMQSAIQTAGINSAATRYAADKSYFSAVDTRNPLSQLLNNFFGGNSGKDIEKTKLSLKSIWDKMHLTAW